MTHLDDLPERDANHDLEEDAVISFQRRLADSGAFIFQGGDRKDYGTDCQIEVIDGGRATNIRIHVQLKGTDRKSNADGSISIDVRRANMNYLLMQNYSFYACYHRPTGSLRMCSAESVLRHYDRCGGNWTKQVTLTVRFAEELTAERLIHLAAIAKSEAISSRNRRVLQSGLSPETQARHVLRAPPHVHVPDDPKRAGRLLRELYAQGADETISAVFEKFSSVLSPDGHAMGLCYMSEINLGMGRASSHPDRIERALAYFESKLHAGTHVVGTVHYTIGNAFSALRDEISAKTAYQSALADPAFANDPEMAAQAHRNLGTSFERLGDLAQAVEHYRESLRLNPDLPEAHNALGNHYAHIGEHEEALKHFDRAVFITDGDGKASAVSGWRATVLFNLGDPRGAFREINGLVSRADSLEWTWPYCARLVTGFGRLSVENAQHAREFWHRYVRANPTHSSARRELLLTVFYLRTEGYDIQQGYEEFRDEFDGHISHIDANDAALPWDRLGHWAQDEADWTEAERCFRKAYELEGGHYGYCLGTALNSLGRFEESLPLLLHQATEVQKDAQSWFEVGIAHANLKHRSDATEAFQMAVALDPDYPAALFELGGACWNAGELKQAMIVWKDAVGRFPEHRLAQKVRRDFPKEFASFSDRPSGS